MTAPAWLLLVVYAITAFRMAFTAVGRQYMRRSHIPWLVIYVGIVGQLVVRAVGVPEDPSSPWYALSGASALAVHAGLLVGFVGWFRDGPWLGVRMAQAAIRREQWRRRVEEVAQDVAERWEAGR